MAMNIILKGQGFKYDVKPIKNIKNNSYKNSKSLNGGKKSKISIEEIPENQVSNRILYIRKDEKDDTIFPLNMEILVVNNKKRFKKQGKYLGSKMTPKYDGMIYTFSFGGKITIFKYKFTDKK